MHTTKDSDSNRKIVDLVIRYNSVMDNTVAEKVCSEIYNMLRLYRSQFPDFEVDCFVLEEKTLRNWFVFTRTEKDDDSGITTTFSKKIINSTTQDLGDLEHRLHFTLASFDVKKYPALLKQNGEDKNLENVSSIWTVINNRENAKKFEPISFRLYNDSVYSGGLVCLVLKTSKKLSWFGDFANTIVDNGKITMLIEHDYYPSYAEFNLSCRIAKETIINPKEPLTLGLYVRMLEFYETAASAMYKNQVDENLLRPLMELEKAIASVKGDVELENTGKSHYVQQFSKEFSSSKIWKTFLRNVENWKLTETFDKQLVHAAAVKASLKLRNLEVFDVPGKDREAFVDAFVKK
jgi:hypothetical protein